MDDSVLPTHFADAPWRRKFARQLLAWFGENQRQLPWRGTRDLYRIWISEIMLQQTQVATVIPYYERFLQSFPDVTTLAAAEEEAVLRHWEGLGYYRRARQLHAAARKIVQEHDGRFPSEYDDVLALPGIGRYTAGAILSIGQDQRLPILEANTIRLLSRLALYSGETNSTAGQNLLWQAAQQILPAQKVGLFNQALMELGSLLCTPQAPACATCPVAQLCPARRLGLQDQIPAPKKPKLYEEVTEAVVVVRRDEKVLLRRCESGERWAGLWDFPRCSLDAVDEGERLRELKKKVVAQTSVEFTGTRMLTTLRHGVTRYRITLKCYEARYVARKGKSLPNAPSSEQAWFSVAQIQALPLNVTARKIALLIASNSHPSSLARA